MTEPTTEAYNAGTQALARVHRPAKQDCETCRATATLVVDAVWSLAMQDIDTEIRDAKRAALLGAQRAIFAEAANGEAANAPALHRAASIVDALRSEVLDGAVT